MVIIRVSGTCDSGSTPDRTTSLFFIEIFKIFKIFFIELKKKLILKTYNKNIEDC